MKEPSKKKVSTIWDEVSEDWADFVRSGKDHSRDFVNNPAAFKLIGNIRNKTVLDIACGEGYNTRIMAHKGAIITGIDFSTRLLELARTEERREQLGIEYYLMSANSLKRFSNCSFDLITCFMALHDIEDYDGAVAEVSRVLKKGGRFIFSIPHPCFEKIVINGVEVDAAERYYENIRYPLYWNMKRLTKPFTTVFFHRPLTDYSRVLAKNGLLTIRMVEPVPSKKAIRERPSLGKGWNRPWAIIFNAVKSC